MQEKSSAPRDKSQWKQRAYDRFYSTSGLHCAKKSARNTYIIFRSDTGARVGMCWAIVKKSRHVSTSVAFDGMPIYVTVSKMPDAIDEALGIRG
jgi:hypothetical protein